MIAAAQIILGLIALIAFAVVSAFEYSDYQLRKIAIKIKDPDILHDAVKLSRRYDRNARISAVICVIAAFALIVIASWSRTV